MKNEFENYDQLEKDLYTNKELKELWSKKCKLFECWRCGKKADFFGVIGLFYHCKKCKKEYNQKLMKEYYQKGK